MGFIDDFEDSTAVASEWTDFTKLVIVIKRTRHPEQTCEGSTQ